MVAASLLDTMYFAWNLYRDDVKELGMGIGIGLGEKEEIVMNEAQFAILESFCQNELKKHERLQSFGTT